MLQIKGIPAGWNAFYFIELPAFFVNLTQTILAFICLRIGLQGLLGEIIN